MDAENFRPSVEIGQVDKKNLIKAAFADRFRRQCRDVVEIIVLHGPSAYQNTGSPDSMRRSRHLINHGDDVQENCASHPETAAFDLLAVKRFSDGSAFCVDL